jgi:hypothetical protein
MNMNVELTSAQRSKKKYVIKQILAKTVANGCTAEEAAAASAKANTMMVTYGFTAADFGIVDYAFNEGTNSAGEPAKPAKKEKKAKTAPVGKRGPQPQYLDHQIITVLKANPKRPGSNAHARYAMYVNGMTVADAVKSGLRRDDFRWDIRKGHIEIK